MSPGNERGTATVTRTALFCVHCRDASASLLRSGPATLTCPACGTPYPVVGERVPVVVRDPAGYVAATFLRYQRYLRRKRRMVEDLERETAQHPWRADVVRRLIQATESNAAIVRAAAERLRPYVTVDRLAQVADASDAQDYAVNYSYLIRDWCWLEDGESELAVIEETIGAVLRKHSLGGGVALVLGAGAGRVAWDLRRDARVVAIDHSFLMADVFHELLGSDLEFFEVTLRNASTAADVVRRREASMRHGRQGFPGAGDEGIEYSVADARSVPLPAQAASFVLSLYFTDTLPLSDFLGEVLRVLRPGGVFLHFGPLGYHHDNVLEMLSAEELGQRLVQAGLEIVEDRHVTTTHARSRTSLVSQVFENAVIAARKP